ncbi:hypothetical protein TCAL_02541 [Tigriopus californicus]|uniref:Uncharacterized protein n=1 Tax=Tigriopus californicus TaxID=6832 RepID=A0A553P6B8_TIGCA|nr:hypothetical protein TCAL_02541 [Tigriopus californicus]
MFTTTNSVVMTTSITVYLKPTGGSSVATLVRAPASLATGTLQRRQSSVAGPTDQESKLEFMPEAQRTQADQHQRFHAITAAHGLIRLVGSLVQSAGEFSTNENEERKNDRQTNRQTDSGLESMVRVQELTREGDDHRETERGTEEVETHKLGSIEIVGKVKPRSPFWGTHSVGGVAFSQQSIDQPRSARPSSQLHRWIEIPAGWPIVRSLPCDPPPCHIELGRRIDLSVSASSPGHHGFLRGSTASHVARGG